MFPDRSPLARLLLDELARSSCCLSLRHYLDQGASLRGSILLELLIQRAIRVHGGCGLVSFNLLGRLLVALDFLKRTLLAELREQTSV